MHNKSKKADKSDKSGFNTDSQVSLSLDYRHGSTVKAKDKNQ